MRLALILFAVFATVASIVGLTGCGGGAPKPNPTTGGSGNGATQDTADAAVDPNADMSSAPATSADLAQPRPMIDMASTDLAGFVNCFGATVCDPATSFCIRLNSGSATNPGTMQTPSCYQPVDCMGAAMNCACITADPVLASSCVNCVDHMDGTYDCYAMQ